MTFQYPSDPLKPSYQLIEKFNDSNGHAMVSELAYDGGGYHALGEAVDFSDGSNAGTATMDAGAAFWLQYYPYLLELIHVNMDGSMVGVKNGQIVDALSFYGADTMSQHRNHYHVAASYEAMQALLGGASAAVVGQGNVPGAIGAALTGAGDSLSSAFQAMSTFTNSIGSAKFWERVGIGAAGVIMAFIGVDVLKRGL